MRLKKKKKKMGRIDIAILCAVILLVCIGIIMVYSSSSYYALYEKQNSEFFLKKELTWSFVGIIVMISTMSIDYHVYKKVTLIGMIGTLILLVAVLFTSDTNGASRWLNIFGVSLQPSEIAKYVVVLFLAMSLDANGRKVKNFWSGVILYLGIAGVFAGLILIEPNLSIASIIMIVTFIMILVGGAEIKHLSFLVPPAIAAGLIAIFTSGYRLKRLTAFLDPWSDPSGKSFQLIQSLYALGSGGVTGVGFGQSKQKALYIPEPHNDFIFAVIGEELGLIGCIFLLSVFLFLIYRGINVAKKSIDNYGLLLATGIISIIAIQIIINIAVVTGSMPVTGVPLPFISYGGTSLVFNLAAMGILLNISRQTKDQEELTK
ncbi:stage V sporulation protein E [Clostridium carnis]